MTLLALGCAEPADDRSATLASAFARADLPLLRARPALSAGRYARMARSAYDFYRGDLAVFARDWRDGASPLSRSRFALDAPLAPGLGDAHPENFGSLLARDGSLALEPNDFDGADRVPYLWDVRRLVIGVALAAKLSNADDPAARARTAAEARAVARACALAYAEAVAAYAHGAPRLAVTATAGGPVLDDVFRRAARDAAARSELDTFTVVDGGARRLRRGVVDPADPENLLQDLPEVARAALAETLRRARAALLDPPPAAYFTVLDAARELASGVASWPRVRAIVLVEGPTTARADDVLLEVKELADPTAGPWFPPWVWSDSVGARVLGGARRAWARPDADPLWAVSTWVGLPVQVRTETDAARTVRVSRMVGARGTPEALTTLGRQLGALLARVHAAPTPDGAQVAGAIAARIGARADAFADEQADVAALAADLTLADWQRFRELLRTRGPLLGFVPDDGDRATPDQRALFGTPATPRDF